MNACEITVVIPLYNKEAEIERTLRSVLSQRTLPHEVIVVDDGSTDRSAEIVAAIAHPLIRLIRQENQGVSAARNRGLREAKTPWVALLDGDDTWREGYLEAVCRLAERYPNCGAYATGFDILNGEELTPANCPKSEGIVDFFREAMHCYVLIPSSTTLNREVALSLGGFPEGMRMGEDQYLWTLLARREKIAFSPASEVIYSRSASNRSATIWQPETCATSLEALYDATGSPISNEYVARVALGKGLLISSRGGTLLAAETLHTFRFTRLNRFAWWKLRLLNSLPTHWRGPLLAAYNRLAWWVAKRGL